MLGTLDWKDFHLQASNNCISGTHGLTPRERQLHCNRHQILFDLFDLFISSLYGADGDSLGRRPSAWILSESNFSSSCPHPLQSAFPSTQLFHGMEISPLILSSASQIAVWQTLATRNALNLSRIINPTLMEGSYVVSLLPVMDF